MNTPPASRLPGAWVLRCVILLMLAGVFAWYFLGPVPFDLNRLWALCAAR